MFKEQLKTLLLLGSMSGILVYMSKILAGTQAVYPAVLISLAFSVFAYFFSSSFILTMYKARPLDPGEHSEIYSILEELSTNMGLPAPKAYYIPSKIANAFATGRNPSNAVVGVTDGILKILDHHELRGVLAHEMSHIKNRDILVMSVASMMAGAIGYLANFARQLAFVITHPRRRDERNEAAGPISLFLATLIMPLAAALIRLAISRNREYLADEEGAKTSRDPLALASALEKLDRYKKAAHFSPLDLPRVSTSSIFIVNPLLNIGALGSLFNTHPPVEERIRRLRKLYERMFKN